MSTSRGSGGGNGGGVQSIPAGSRKMVRSLKEVVSCSEAEIYATLKDCNMDPNEAVNRLLSQDPFHEVKSKREKKKEGKDTPESQSRGANHNASRGGKINTDRYINRGGSTPSNSSESAPLPGKLSSYNKESESIPYTSYLSSMPGTSGNNRSRVPAGLSEGASAENKGSSSSLMADAMPSGQSVWMGAPGQVSMADIVKMGRPYNKTSNGPNASYHNFRSPEDTYEDPESGISSVQNLPTNEEWPSIEKPAATKVISVPEQYLQAPGVPADSINQPSEAEGVEEVEDDSENSEASNVGLDSISSRMTPEEDSRSASLFENDLYKNMGSYHHRAHDFHEVEEVGASVSSVTRNLQQLNVEKDDRGLPSEGYAPSVVIPDHLQVQNVDCSHLSFGSFGSGKNAIYSSGPKTSLPLKSNLEEPHNEADVSSVGHLNNRSSEYFVDDSLGNASDGGLFHRNSASAGSYNPSSASQTEELNPETAEVAHGNQRSYPPNVGYTFDDAQRLNAPFSQASTQMQNLASFSDVTQSYTNSLPSTLAAANVHTGRESDLHYSQFPVTQSTSTKYGNSVSTIGVSAISVSEALKTAGSPHPQHIAVHPYSQPTIPLGPFTNMIGYPFLPQSYTYLPSAFQQTFAGNSGHHRSLEAVLPQYKNNVFGGHHQSLTSAAAAGVGASGYGAFGNTTTIPGNFPMNPPAAPSGTTLSYDNVLSSQYKDRSHLVSLQQQNENSGMWLHGLNSRTMPAVPASNYFNYHQHGQNHQTGGGFRQIQQQLSQNYGTHGYPDFYHSQGGGISFDQPHNLRDGSLGSLQGQPKHSQIWQNGY